MTTLSLRCSVIATILLLSACVTANAQTTAVDANRLVRLMVAKYQTAQTFQETSETHIRLGNNPEVIQDTELEFMRPNLVMLITRDPGLGSIKTCSNGHLVTLYSGRENIFVQIDAPVTLVKMADTISTASQQLLDTPLNQVLSPLSFLAAHGSLIEAKTFTYAGREMVEGHRTVIVKALADPDWVRSTIYLSGNVVLDRRDVSLWIDPVTNTLIRSEALLAWHRVDETGETASSIKFQETHRGQMFDRPIRPEFFKLPLPKGAKEKFSDHR